MVFPGCMFLFPSFSLERLPGSNIRRCVISRRVERSKHTNHRCHSWTDFASSNSDIQRLFLYPFFLRTRGSKHINWRSHSYMRWRPLAHSLFGPKFLRQGRDVCFIYFFFGCLFARLPLRRLICQRRWFLYIHQYLTLIFTFLFISICFLYLFIFIYWFIYLCMVHNCAIKRHESNYITQIILNRLSGFEYKFMNID